MRLLHVRRLKFVTFYPPDIPTYVTASHRWDLTAEAGLLDIELKRNTTSTGYKKIQGFCAFIDKHFDTVEWLWIDTCCIDQKSSQEVSESINSMFNWYQTAELCLAYLRDVTRERPKDVISQFEESEWFNRCWTLQELLAPRVVVFLTKEWDVIGHKGYGEFIGNYPIDLGPSLISRIANVTRIPAEVLTDYNRIQKYGVTEKMSWLSGRRATREEDRAYCMLGIFGVFISLIYGEREENAFMRLEKAIKKKTKRQSRASENFALIYNERMNLRPSECLDTQQPIWNQQTGHLGRDLVLTKQEYDSSLLEGATSQQNKPRLICEILSEPTEHNCKYEYFLDGKDLSFHTVMRLLGSGNESIDRIRISTHDGRNGFRVRGDLLGQDDLADLILQSQYHSRERRLDRALFATS